MRVYVSVDMEGVAGVATEDQIIRAGTGYPRAQQLMTAETNAAVCGAFDAGAQSVTVNDSHGNMDNLLLRALDPRAELIIGSPKAQCMAHGLTADYDIAMFVGYHAAAGDRGVLAHTFSSYFSGFRLNGNSVSEAEVNALYAAEVGVGVGLVTGDDVICALARSCFPDLVTVEVKKAEGFTAARSLHPSVACDAIRLGAAEAVARADKIGPVVIPDKLVLDVEMQFPTAAELAACVPGSEQVGALVVRHELTSPDELL